MELLHGNLFYLKEFIKKITVDIDIHDNYSTLFLQLKLYCKRIVQKE